MRIVRYAAAAVFFAGTASACSAIIAGTFADTDAIAGLDGSSIVPGTSGGTSGNGTTGGPADPCSIRKHPFNDYLVDASTCSDCIDRDCANEISYACNGGDPHPWLATMQGCAQKPWNGYAPPGINDSWGCTSYAKLTQEELKEISANGSPDEHKRKSEICVYGCIYGAGHPCWQCDPYTLDGTQSRVYLRDDPCGKCFVQNCPETLVECCDAQGPMEDFIENCSYTGDPARKTLCIDLGFVDAGVGSNHKDIKYYDEHGKTCVKKLQDCFIQHCKEQPACQP